MIKTQEAQLEEVFLQIKAKLTPYSKQLTVLTDRPNRYEICADKPYQVTSKKTGNVIKKQNAYFAGIITQKNYVGFYFMPAYNNDVLKSLPDNLRKKLKGKTCFHFKTADDIKHLDALLKKGFDSFKNSNLI